MASLESSDGGGLSLLTNELGVAGSYFLGLAESASLRSLFTLLILRCPAGLGGCLARYSGDRRPASGLLAEHDCFSPACRVGSLPGHWLSD